MKYKNILLSIAIITAFALSGCGANETETVLPILGDVHNHADFKIYIHNEPLNFAQEKYMSDKDKTLSNFIHVHDMDGDVIHQHMSTIKLKEFFKSIGMELNNDCFVTDDGTKYCNEGNKTLKMFVNGNLQNDIENYEFKDLDRILISYGNDDQATIQKQIESVTDKACIQSQKCPERGKPHNESTCITGGTTDCLPATPLNPGSQEETESTQQTQVSDTIEMPVKIFLVALDDDGKSGKAIGCGDSLVMVERKVIASRLDPSAEYHALKELFSIKNQKDPISGLYNALYQSNLTYISGSVGEKAVIYLSGTYALGGTCDTARFEAQLKETILQNTGAKKVEIFINDKPLEKILSTN